MRWFLAIKVFITTRVDNQKLYKQVHAHCFKTPCLITLVGTASLTITGKMKIFQTFSRMIPRNRFSPGKHQ